MQLDNERPEIFAISKEREITQSDFDEALRDAFDAREIFDLIRKIKDPEHPMTLEQLNVVQEAHITVKLYMRLYAPRHSSSSKVDDEGSYINITFTPTIEHCSMATLIGLSLRVQLLRTLPCRFKVDIAIHPNTHKSEDTINKQLADKERVSAALENGHLLQVVNQCLCDAL